MGFVTKTRVWTAGLVVAGGLLGGVSTMVRADQDTIQDVDPWEGVNRKIFVFNDTLDRFFLKPVAQGYRFITPDPVETGVDNVFSNLMEIKTTVNSVLQWKWREAGHSSGRFLINTTMGVAGIFDVASVVGIKDAGGEDFGQTLAVWGVGSGPYVVIPLLGSSTLRDGLATPVDTTLNPVGYIDHVPTRNSTYGAGIINTRAKLLDAEELISGDRYTFIRDAYLQRRRYLIDDGKVEDSFGGDYGDEYGDYGDE